MADASEGTSHGFTREQIDFLQEQYGRKTAEGFDRPTQMWLIGGLVAIGIAVSSVLWAQIGANRTEIGSVRTELRAEIRENRAAINANRDAIAELAKGMARIEAILEERLPRSP